MEVDFAYHVYGMHCQAYNFKIMIILKDNFVRSFVRSFRSLAAGSFTPVDRARGRSTYWI